MDQLLNTLSEQVSQNKEQMEQISSILYKNIYEMETMGGPLYTSIEEVPKKEKNRLNAEMCAMLNKILQLVNKLEDDDLFDATKTIHSVFPFESDSEVENSSGGRRKNTHKTQKKQRRQRRQ